MKNTLWTERYRPDTVDGYVFKDESVKQMVTRWVTAKDIPHILFSGGPGTGKTTLSKIIMNEIGIQEYDRLEINASRERGIEEIRFRITNFVQTMPFGLLKVVLLDEADFLTAEAQAAMRGVMETYSSTARFILTCNHPNKIIPALHSRCQQIHIDKLDSVEFVARAAQILIEESVEFDLDILDTYVKGSYPDLRKCLNLLQPNIVDGKLVSITEAGNTSLDFKVEMVDLFKKGKIREARNLIVSQARPEDVEEIIRWTYDNLGLWSKTEKGQDRAILIIRDGLVNNTLCSDQEINLSAMFCELTSIED